MKASSHHCSKLIKLEIRNIQQQVVEEGEIVWNEVFEKICKYLVLKDKGDALACCKMTLQDYQRSVNRNSIFVYLVSRVTLLF